MTFHLFQNAFSSGNQPGRGGDQGDPDYFVSTLKEHQRIEKIQTQLRELIEQTFPNTEAFIDGAARLGIPILCDGPDMQVKLCLMVVGCEQGFIPPTLHKYEDLIKSLKTMFPKEAQMDFSKGVILLNNAGKQFSFLTYQVYHYLAHKHGLEGYQDLARKLYQSYLKKYKGQLTPRFLNKLDLNKTYQLKMAIRRDREALEFLRKSMNEIFVPRNNARLIGEGKAQA